MLKDILINLFVAAPLSAYTGIIVSRYYLFLSSLNEARRLVLNIEQTWEYRYLDQTVVDPQSSSGKRSVFMSKTVATNDADWQLTQVGLLLKEQGHWRAASVVDDVSGEIESLRGDFISKAKLRVDGEEREVTEFIADWHRTLSCQRPNLWQILRPWRRKRYEHMSCVSVNEETGEWAEVVPARESKKPHTEQHAT